MRTGINHSTITRLLRDDGRQPTLATIVALLRLFGAQQRSEVIADSRSTNGPLGSTNGALGSTNGHQGPTNGHQPPTNGHQRPTNGHQADLPLL
jgi:hypothetical protein